MSDTREFVLIGGPAHQERIALEPSAAQALVGADGQQLAAMWPPSVVMTMLDAEFEELPDGIEGPARPDPVVRQEAKSLYIQRRIVAALPGGDILQWTVYVHESIEMSGEFALALMREWGLV